MNETEKTAKFTGERFIIGESGRRIAADHLERYRFACNYVRDREVLDIACGTGYGAPLMLDAGASTYVGVDINEECVQYAREKHGSSRSVFSVGDIGAFAQKDNFDAITCFETIEHVGGYRTALKNLFLALRPNGVLMISSPNRPITSPKARSLNDKPGNEFHVQEFTPEELKDELTAVGFEECALFGQRQRWSPNCSCFQTVRSLTRFPDLFAYVASPKVTPVTTKTSRYFVVVAKKN